MKRPFKRSEICECARPRLRATYGGDPQCHCGFFIVTKSQAEEAKRIERAQMLADAEKHGKSPDPSRIGR